MLQKKRESLEVKDKLHAIKRTDQFISTIQTVRYHSSRMESGLELKATKEHKMESLKK